MIDRTTKELTADDIATIADTYHAWRSTPEELAERVKRGDSKLAQYEDQAGFCKVATIEEIKANDYVLTRAATSVPPSRKTTAWRLKPKCASCRRRCLRR
jgi:type I restriction-modification system DNA methylase subunit